jgi:exonuclease III
MKIATWNINSIKSRIDHVLKWCQVNQPDVLCLQKRNLSMKNSHTRNCVRSAIRTSSTWANARTTVSRSSQSFR